MQHVDVANTVAPVQLVPLKANLHDTSVFGNSVTLYINCLDMVNRTGKEVGNVILVGIHLCKRYVVQIFDIHQQSV